MIVVSDTSPITALLVIGEAALLPALFNTILVPSAVSEELLRFHFPLPTWIQVRPVADRSRVERLQQRLHRGEAEAIALAIELGADNLLIDERKGRRVAREHGLPVIGLMGVRSILDRLEADGVIYISRSLRDMTLHTAGE